MNRQNEPTNQSINQQPAPKPTNQPNTNHQTVTKPTSLVLILSPPLSFSMNLRTALVTLNNNTFHFLLHEKRTASTCLYC